jgi:hypothetical protein
MPISAFGEGYAGITIKRKKNEQKLVFLTKKIGEKTSPMLFYFEN